MERLNDILVNLLKTDSRYFTDEGELLKNAGFQQITVTEDLNGIKRVVTAIK